MVHQLDHTRLTRIVLAATLVAGGLLAVLAAVLPAPPAMASSSPTPPASVPSPPVGGPGRPVLAPPTSAPVLTARVQEAKAALEQELEGRAQRLAVLAGDLAQATDLTPAHATLLSTRVGQERASIAHLAAKVPGDRTRAEVRADRLAMLHDNRVYAVMSPQVLETITGDAYLVRAAALQAEELALASEVASLKGRVGERAARRYDRDLVRRVAAVMARLHRSEARVLAATPKRYPSDAHVLVAGNRALLAAGLSLAHASYDAELIDLTAGGVATAS